MSKLQSPPQRGGVDAHQENAAKPPLKAQTGWSFWNNYSRLTTPALRATPPVPGGEYVIHNIQAETLPDAGRGVRQSQSSDLKLDRKSLKNQR